MERGADADAGVHEHIGLEAQLNARAQELARRQQGTQLSLLRAQLHELRTPTAAGVAPRVYVARGQLYFETDAPEQAAQVERDIQRIVRPDFHA